MAADAGIFGQIRPYEQPNMLAQAVQGAQLGGALQQNRLAELQMTEYARKRQQEDALRQAIVGAGNDTDAIGKAYLGQGDVGGYNAFQKAQADAAKSKTDQQAAQFKLAHDKTSAFLNILGGAKDQPSYDLARQQAQALGIDVAGAPAVFDPNYVSAIGQQALTAQQRLDAELKRRGFDVTMRGQDITRQNSVDSNATSRANNASSVGATIRGQNMTDARAGQGQALQREAARSQVVDTENGPVLVDKATGQARPVVAQDGVSLRKPGREIPAAASKSIMENRQNISKIDDAIAQIQKRPSSVGPVNMLPGVETARQYTDPEGVLARAGVADVGSLILHDRSGAAVTASETPRLRPFIPSASDRPEVAIMKLKRFKDMYEQEANLLADSYNARQGYRAPASPAATPAAGSADIDALLKKYGK